jgi:hypothetical protein
MLNPTPQSPGKAGGAEPTPSKRDQLTAAPAAAPVLKKKFQNGWTREIENLMAEWADKAVCYRWMHERTERVFSRKDMGFMFPVIILSTVTGAANFAMESVLTDPEHKKYAQLCLGGLSIATGIISTIANRLGYGSASEAHKGAAILWGKFQRLIAIELSLHPDERSDCMHFLKQCRGELDRLIEQSPTIPTSIINACKSEFKQYPKVKKPEIIGDIDTTHIFVDKGGRLKKLAEEATLAIQQKKGVLKQMVLDDLEPRISNVIEHSTLPAIKEELRRDLQRAAEKATKEAIAAVAAGRVTAASVTAAAGGRVAPTASSASVERAAAERAKEMAKIAKSGLVSEMRNKLVVAKAKTGDAPAGIGLLFIDENKPIEVSTLGEEDIVIHVEEAQPAVAVAVAASAPSEDEDEEEDVAVRKPLTPERKTPESDEEDEDDEIEREVDPYRKI